MTENPQPNTSTTSINEKKNNLTEIKSSNTVTSNEIASNQQQNNHQNNHQNNQQLSTQSIQSVSEEAQIIARILSLDEMLKKEKFSLLQLRTYKFVGVSSASSHIRITDIKFSKKDTFFITYEHNTDTYTENNYVYGSDSETDDVPYSMSTVITFGCRMKNKFYIKGNRDRFDIYITSDGQINIISKDYDYEYEVSHHRKKINTLSNNQNVPEWFALKFILLCEDESYEDIYRYFMTV